MIRAYHLCRHSRRRFPTEQLLSPLSLTQIEVFISTKTKSRFVNRDRRAAAVVPDSTGDWAGMAGGERL